MRLIGVGAGCCRATKGQRHEAMAFILEEADFTYANEGNEAALLCPHGDTGLLMESPYGTGIFVDFADNNRSNRELRETPSSRRRGADTSRGRWTRS